MRRAVVAKYPESRPARFALARQLLRANDPDGVAPMEALIETEPHAFLAGAELLRDYFGRRNEKERAHQWQERFSERSRELPVSPRRAPR